MRYFNKEGPVNPAEHYCIDLLSRVNLPEILTLIARKKYFVSAISSRISSSLEGCPWPRTKESTIELVRYAFHG